MCEFHESESHAAFELKRSWQVNQNEPGRLTMYRARFTVIKMTSSPLPPSWPRFIGEYGNSNGLMAAGPIAAAAEFERDRAASERLNQLALQIKFE